MYGHVITLRLRNFRFIPWGLADINRVAVIDLLH